MSPAKISPKRDTPEPVGDELALLTSALPAFRYVVLLPCEKAERLLEDLSVRLLDAEYVADVAVVNEVRMGERAVPGVGGDHLEQSSATVALNQLLGELADSTELIGPAWNGALVHTDGGFGRNQMRPMNSSQTVWGLLVRSHQLDIWVIPAVHFTEALSIDRNHAERKSPWLEVTPTMLGFDLAVQCLTHLKGLQSEELVSELGVTDSAPDFGLSANGASQARRQGLDLAQ